MKHVFGLVWILVRSIIFDDKDESDIRSPKFNARKFIAAIMLLLSITLNLWQGWRQYDLGKEYIAYREFIKENDKALYEKSHEFNKKKPE